jgi:hypothetical protein
MVRMKLILRVMVGQLIDDDDFPIMGGNHLTAPLASAKGLCADLPVFKDRSKFTLEPEWLLRFSPGIFI